MSEADVELREVLESVKLRLLAEASERRSCCKGRTSREPIEVGSLGELLEYVRGCKGVIITFYSPTCPYCRAFAPVYALAAGEYGERIPFLRVNTWTLPEAAQLFGVMGVPMTFGIARGKPVAVAYGYVDYEELEDLVVRTLHEAGCGAEGGATA